MMRVANMTSPRTGRPVANQYILSDDTRDVFQSYESTIIEIDRKTSTITVHRDYDYSTTTAKYRNEFMRMQGFDEMADRKGFEKFLTLGKVGNFSIIKAF
jgi:hypothetical protein